MNMSFVITTYPNEEKAKELAKEIIKKRLAACASIAKVKSIYWWEGKIVDEDEALVLFKTSSGKVNNLFNEIERTHPYDVPEIVEVKVSNVSKDYLDWLIRGVIDFIP